MKQKLLKCILIGFAVCLIVLSVAALAACDKKEPEHEHTFGEYEVTTPADCTTPGEMTRECTVCGYKQTLEIAAGHDWSEFVETTPAKCETDGEMTRRCYACGDKETQVINATGHKWSKFVVTTEAKCLVDGEQTRTCSECGDFETEVITATGHSWQEVEIIEEATCENTGLRSAKCENCDATTDADVIPALGHTRGKVLPVDAPSCEQTGTNRVTCSVCGKGYTETVPATGHSYSEDFTVDKNPTIDEEGEQSRHCTNRNCNSRTDIETIPKLINEANFRIYIVRGENQTLLPSTFNPMIRIINAEGKTVVTTFVFGNSNKEHIFEQILPLGTTYTVKIVNTLPTGFECGEYTVSAANGTYPYDTPDKYPTVTMHVYSYLGTGAMTNGDKKNQVLNDFSVTTIDNVTVTLSELLKEKKLVWLNFYYNNCFPCQSEASEIVRVAKLFDVAVICFNDHDSVEDIRSAAKSTFEFPDSFYLVQDSGGAYGKLFGRTAYPTNVFIDSGGCVFESVTGSTYSSQFYSYVSNNIFTTPEKSSSTSSATVVQMPAILPVELKERLCDE